MLAPEGNGSYSTPVDVVELTENFIRNDGFKIINQNSPVQCVQFKSLTLGKQRNACTMNIIMMYNVMS